MKVYLNHEAKHAKGEAPEFKVKTTLPKGWLDGPVEKVIAFFCKQYNAKNPDHALDPEKMQLQNKNDVVLPSSGKVSDHISEYNDLFIVHKPEVVVTKVDRPEGSVQCKNLGCNTWYVEEMNSDTACHYHSGAPVFHDLAKFWSCCEGTKAMDWEEFQAIPACCVGRHCNESKVELFKPSSMPMPTAQPLTEAEIREAEAAAAPAAPAPVVEDKPGPIIDGMARCRNRGCTVDKFVVAENHDEACHYHELAPVFHDTAKYWACCPKKKCFDWDDFMKVPTCKVGPHKV